MLITFRASMSLIEKVVAMQTIMIIYFIVHSRCFPKKNNYMRISSENSAAQLSAIETHSIRIYKRNYCWYVRKVINFAVEAGNGRPVIFMAFNQHWFIDGVLIAHTQSARWSKHSGWFLHRFGFGPLFLYTTNCDLIVGAFSSV